jgi:hypothetical protein
MKSRCAKKWSSCGKVPVVIPLAVRGVRHGRRTTARPIVLGVTHHIWRVVRDRPIYFFTVYWVGMFYTIIGLGDLVMLIRDRLKPMKEQVQGTVSKIPVRTLLRVMACIGISVFVAQFMFVVFALRADMNRYILPRTLKDQADGLQKALSATPSDVKVNILSYVADQEAMEYAGELFTAIKAGGWDAQFRPVNPWNSKDQPESYIPPFFPILIQGLTIDTCIVGQPTNPDPKHPDPSTLLRNAFDKAHVEIGGSGLKADCEKYSLDIIVGRRPFKLGEQPPV